MTLPTLKVLLDNGTGTFPFNISPYVLADAGYSVSRGRDDWQSSVTAGELGLTLNNSDGRFTPGSTLITSPSPIVVDQRIRLQETVNGVTYTRFTGYVKSWPVEWPATVPTFAQVRLSATDAQARAERRPLQSLLLEELRSDSPVATYPLAEDAGSTAAGDTSGNQSPALVITGTGTAMTFGSGIGPADGLTCASLLGGTFLRNAIPKVYLSAGATTLTLECYFTSTQIGTGGTIVQVDSGDPFTGAFFLLNNLGKLSAGVVGSGVLTSAASVNDGLVHHAALTMTGGTVTLYLDGVNVSSAGGVPALPADMVRFNVAPTDIVLSTPFVGTVAHAGVYSTALSAARVASHASGLNGFAGESGTARMTRIAGYVGIPIGSLDSSLTNVTAGNTDESTAWNEIQAASDAELGLVFIDGNGALGFHNRNRVVAKTTSDLTLTSQWVTPDVTPVSDDQQLVNYIEVTAEGTGAAALVRSATSEASHGRYPGSRSYSVQTDAEALDRANWLITTLAEPTPRYGTLTVNLYGMTPAQASTVIAALDVDCWLRVTSMAPQNPGGTIADVIVQGWSETTTADTWTIACNVVARTPLFSPVWILDDTTFSVLGTTTKLYL